MKRSASEPGLRGLRERENGGRVSVNQEQVSEQGPVSRKSR